MSFLEQREAEAVARRYEAWALLPDDWCGDRDELGNLLAEIPDEVVVLHTAETLIAAALLRYEEGFEYEPDWSGGGDEPSSASC